MLRLLCQELTLAWTSSILCDATGDKPPHAQRSEHQPPRSRGRIALGA